MAGKTNKTRVTLPGSLADLVRDLQDGGNVKPAQQSTAEENEDKETVSNESANNETVNNVSTESAKDETHEAPVGNKPEAEQKNQDDSDKVPDGFTERTNRPIGSERQREGSDDRQQRGRPQKENTMREYHVQKDDSADSWDLFLDLARQYKTGGGRPATIYIDPALKNILDRLKYPLSLTTSAILSSIVARFIYDHEDDVRKAIFSQNIF